MSAARLATLSQKIDLRLFVRVILCVSTLYGFWLSYDMNSYRSLRVCLVGAMLDTIAAHLGLWVATFQIRSRWRFLAVPAFLVSMVGVFFIWAIPGLYTSVIALVGATWLFFNFLKGRSLGY